MKVAFGIPIGILFAATVGGMAIASPPSPSLQANLPNELGWETKENHLQSIDAPISFIRAMRNLIVSDIHVLDNSFSLSANTPGMRYEIDARIQTIIERPNRFQSTIQFMSPEEIDGPQYLITSNGQQVWIYDPSLNVYSVMTYDEFMNDYSDGIFVGIFINFLLSFLEESEELKYLAEISEEELFQNEDLINQIITSLELENSRLGVEMINGIEYVTFTITDPDFTTIFYINPTTSQIEDIRLMGYFEGVSILVGEYIRYSEAPNTIPQNYFNFRPPANAQLLDTPILLTP